MAQRITTRSGSVYEGDVYRKYAMRYEEATDG